MKIVLVNSTDQGGCAEKVCIGLHRSYLQQGYKSVFLVAHKKNRSPLDHSDTTNALVFALG